MTDHEDVSLFVGCLPGEEMRQVVLFPGGEVLADVREQEIQTPTADSLPDQGWTAACALVKTLTDNGGWYIEEVTADGNGWWLKPRSESRSWPSVRIKGVNLNGRTDGPAGENQP